MQCHASCGCAPAAVGAAARIGPEDPDGTSGYRRISEYRSHSADGRGALLVSDIPKLPECRLQSVQTAEGGPS
eukprot:COSAG02_NODE_174_length_31243_cov_76.084543_24_plen_73_part_00